jgi:glucose/arabinose dehydrogenase
MQNMLQRLSLLAIFMIVGFGPVVAQAQVSDGWLVRADDDAKVYYVDGGLKRHIDSWETLVAQGLRGEPIVTLAENVFDDLEEGDPVTADTKLIRPGETAVLPDLAPLAMRDIRYLTVNGREVIKFSSLFRNQGNGPIELVAEASGDADGDGLFDTYQHLAVPGQAARDVLVGSFLWHAEHNHYHYTDFSDYVLRFVRPLNGQVVTPPDAITSKTTFCLRDDMATTWVNGRALPSAFSGACNKLRQGVSVGWADNYPSTLPDQYIDVQDLPAGIYRLDFVVDPQENFLELRQDNNVSVVFLEIDPARNLARVIASGAPFVTTDNYFPNGTLLKAEGDSKVYVMHHGRKRWLASEEIFRGYGYSFANVYEVPAAVLNAMSSQAVVRVQGGTDVYLLNEAGYRRRVLNPAILTSYGLTGAHIAEISALELASHPDTTLIQQEGSGEVYSIESKTIVTNYDPAAVQVVNATDFQAYATQTVATGLNVPWDIAFLPDGDMLVTERPGTLRRLGTHPNAFTIPAVAGAGEGGLMGIALHPEFTSNGQVYLYYTTSDPSRNKVARFVLSDTSLTFDKVIMDNIPSAIYHDGGQISFGPDGMLYLTTGDANNPAAAQDLSSLAGKTLRVTPEGGTPADNPFGTPVWSYGHRNAQGLAWDDQGRLWQTEHGRSGAVTGFDELNLVEKGKNYGWPTIEGMETQNGLVTPVQSSSSTVTWAPSGIAYLDGTVYFAGLKGASLYAADVNADGTVSNFRQYFTSTYGRLRGVVVGPNGFLYITTSNRDGRGTAGATDDRIIRIAPDFLE